MMEKKLFPILMVALLLACADAHAASTIPSPGDTWTDTATGMEFVWVPGGCFLMGSPSGEKDRDDDEGPVHEVCVDGFWMGKFEVTNEQYRRYKAGHDSKDYKGKSLNSGSQPAVFVSWNDATVYAQWLSEKGNGTFRLPTEAEWEYAARAGTTTSRYWGDDPDEACQYANVGDRTAKRIWPDWIGFNCDDGYAVTAPVGSFKPNAFGLYDMMGNVWEWCADVYDPDAYFKHSQKNPFLSGGSEYRVTRGASSYNDEPRHVRAANRLWGFPGGAGDCLGFRLLRTN